VSLTSSASASAVRAASSGPASATLTPSTSHQGLAVFFFGLIFGGKGQVNHTEPRHRLSFNTRNEQGEHRMSLNTRSEGSRRGG